MTIRNLDSLFAPRSSAVIGASNRPNSVGGTAWRNLRNGRFSGPVHAVNPKYDTLDGDPVVARVAYLPSVPDLAVICSPAPTVPGLIAELGALGTRAAIVMPASLDIGLPDQVLDGIDHHLAANGDQQDVIGDPHVLVSGRRNSNPDDHLARDRVDQHAAWQGLAQCPFLGLARWHAAIVLFGKAGRTPALGVLLPVIVQRRSPVLIAEIGTDLDLRRIAFALVMLLSLSLTSVFRLGRQRQAANH